MCSSDLYDYFRRKTPENAGLGGDTAGNRAAPRRFFPPAPPCSPKKSPAIRPGGANGWSCSKGEEGKHEATVVEACYSRWSTKLLHMPLAPTNHKGPRAQTEPTDPHYGNTQVADGPIIRRRRTSRVWEADERAVGVRKPVGVDRRRT